MRTKNTNNEATKAVSKDDLLKITEDPYFQYLVEKKARSQTRAYLVLVGSAILAIFAYGGWEFKSAKDQIEKEKIAIIATQKEIRETAADVKSKKDEVFATSSSIGNTIESAKELTTSTKEFADQNVSLANSMLATAKENISVSQEAQKGFFEQQGRILESVSKVNDSAKTQIQEAMQKANEQLNAVRTLSTETDNKVSKTETKVKDVLDKAQNIATVQSKLDTLTTKATELDTIQNRLLQGGIVATVLMRSRVPSTIKLLDPNNPSQKESDWTITFTKFKLSDKKMQLWGEARKESSSERIGFHLSDINAEPSETEHPFNSLRKFGIPFKIQLNFAYHTLMSRDFASLKIVGEVSSNIAEKSKSMY